MHFELFKELPLFFFRPLSGELAPIYSGVLSRLYELDFEGEPFEITQETAVEQSALLIEQSPDYVRNASDFRARVLSDTLGPDERIQEELLVEVDERETRRLARQLLKRLEKCGWFDYEYREGRKGYVLNFRDYSARILHTLNQIAQKEQPLFEGLARSIKSSLSDLELNEHPGVSLHNAKEATRSLVREIKILSRNIKRYIDEALKSAKTPGALLTLQLDIYQKKVITASYHRFKTTDNIFKYRSFILKQLFILEFDQGLKFRAMEWILKSKTGIQTAEEQFYSWIELIRNQLSSVHLLTEELDKKNARYTATTLQRISYLLNQDELIENRLVSLLTSYGEGLEKKTFLPTPYFSAFKISTWDQNSLYRIPKEKMKMELERIEIVPITDESKAALLKKVKLSIESQFSKKKVYEIAKKMIQKNGGAMHLNQVPLEEPRDFAGLIFISYHGYDKKAPYSIRLDKNKSRTLINQFEIRDGEMSWKDNKNDR